MAVSQAMAEPKVKAIGKRWKTGKTFTKSHSTNLFNQKQSHEMQVKACDLKAPKTAIIFKKLSPDLNFYFRRDFGIKREF